MDTFKFSDYFTKVRSLLDHSDIESQCESVVKVLCDVAASGRYIYVCGNGGSAATSDHFVNDLISINPKLPSIQSVRAISLCSNSSILTCISNDESFAEVYVSHLRKVLGRHDVVIGISASGTSQNVIRALSYANDSGAISIGISGFTGGVIKTDSQYAIYVPSDYGEYGPVEDAHSIICHSIALKIKCLLEGHHDWKFPHD